MNIAIIPSQDQWLNNNLFDITNGRDNILKRFSLLKEELNKKVLLTKVIAIVLMIIGVGVLYLR